MPELTGTPLATPLHQLRPELPILLMTGYSGPLLTEQASHAGIRAILQKPLQSRDIAASLARYLIVERPLRRAHLPCRREPHCVPDALGDRGELITYPPRHRKPPGGRHPFFPTLPR